MALIIGRPFLLSCERRRGSRRGSRSRSRSRPRFLRLAVLVCVYTTGFGLDWMLSSALEGPRRVSRKPSKPWAEDRIISVLSQGPSCGLDPKVRRVSFIQPGWVPCIYKYGWEEKREPSSVGARAAPVTFEQGKIARDRARPARATRDSRRLFFMVPPETQGVPQMKLMASGQGDEYRRALLRDRAGGDPRSRLRTHRCCFFSRRGVRVLLHAAAVTWTPGVHALCPVRSVAIRPR